MSYFRCQNMLQIIFTPTFTTPGLGNLGEVLDNDTKTRDKMTLNKLGAKKGESESLSMIMKKRT